MKITRQDLEKLNVYEAIVYVGGLEPEYIQRPSKPILASKHTAVEVKEYAKNLEQYDIDLAEYSVKEKADNEVRIALNEVLEDYIKDMSGLYDIVPKANQNKVWAYAWQQGHSSGYSEIYNYLQELVELFE